MSSKLEKHVLGLSGGKDSTALAIHMNEYYPELDIEYFFTDTGKELPEVTKYLSDLEAILGKPITQLNPDRDFDYWLMVHNGFLPNSQARWCTRKLKIHPFEEWVKPMIENGYTVYSYVAIRADEEFREGYNSKDDKLIVKLPLKEAGIDKVGVLELLQRSGLGLPDYYEWRSRSGCTFCFFQQKIEWVRLKERHPEAFEEAKSYEKKSTASGSPFTWSEGESLDDMMRPERVKQIKEDHKKRLERLKAKKQKNPLRPDDESIDIDELYGQAKVCLSCHK